MDETFYTLEPEQFEALALDSYNQSSLQEMAYFLWNVYPEDLNLMAWRKEKLLPLLKTPINEIEDLI